jgi:hypothetical protein
MTVRTRSKQDLGHMGVMTQTGVGISIQAPLHSRMYQRDQSITDHVVPGFNRLVASGVILINPVSNVKSTRTRTGGGSYYATKGSQISSINGSGSLTDWFLRLSPVGNLTIQIPSDLMSGVQHSAVARVDKTPYAFAEDVATLDETLRLVRRPLNELEGLGRSFQKEVSALMGRYKWMTRAVALAQVYLQYRFGISPVLQSANSIMEAYTKKVVRPKRRTAVYNNTWTDKKQDQVGTGFVYRRTCEVTIKVVAGIIYEVSNPVTDWKFAYGFRFKDIPRLMWELIPYSFMVDRVSAIGDSVAGVANLLDPSVSILGGWTSSKTTTTTGISAINQVSSGWTVSVSPDWNYLEQDSFSRNKWTPSLRDTIPGVNLGGLTDSATKLADLTALIIQRFK